MPRTKKEFIKIREYLNDFLKEDISHITTIDDSDKRAIWNIMVEFFYEKIHNKLGFNAPDALKQLTYGKELYEKIFPDRIYSATVPKEETKYKRNQYYNEQFM